MSDQHIIDLLRGRQHHQAFKKLYAYFPACKKMIRTKGGTTQEALDIYQDALVILCRNVQKQEFKLTSSLNTYIYSVCKFLWNDEIKRKARIYRNTPKPDLLFDELELSEKEMENERQVNLAKKVLQQMGDRCLELFQYFYFQKLDMKTIAEKMEFSSENVAKNQKYKCLERAKDNYQKMAKTV